ncbi:ArsO family NAD(P)H-dependent flavin-containing monooxygenase [Spirosoma rigui]|uniref:ArsO family NAD(P)H-dependent flavin-containing monooxygenase n=1 Tax=Spirosoma rigui TaxID=564064 RepID=UPI0009B16582|nr:ArsO family NAD(P)H-dependent flavin-containing monooxygenase [Spirosoma rigui]
MNTKEIVETDVVVIGAGQSGLAVGYFLRRIQHPFVLLDAQLRPGGAWLHGWDSLRLFSPADASSLPGWPMPRPADDHTGFPDRQHVIDYLTRYEARYALPVRRPVTVQAVSRSGSVYSVQTDTGIWRTRAVISTTGSWTHPVIPAYPGRTLFQGVQLHSAHYRSPESMVGKRVLVVGGGNSGAQILSDVSRVADATWVTLTEPVFLPDEVDGRVLFGQATAQYRALQDGNGPSPAGNLGHIVMVPSVQDARSRGVLHAVRPFQRLTPTGVVWPDGRSESIDVIIWCTGFQPATEHLRPLDIVDAAGRVATSGTRAVDEPGLWLVGYGSWTGFASATLIGVGRSARQTADEVRAYLAAPVNSSQ